MPETGNLLKEKIEDLQESKAEIEEINDFRALAEAYRSGEYTYDVRGKDFKVETTTEVSHISKYRVALPSFSDEGDLFIWLKKRKCTWTFFLTQQVFSHSKEPMNYLQECLLVRVHPNGPIVDFIYFRRARLCAFIHCF